MTVIAPRAVGPGARELVRGGMNYDIIIRNGTVIDGTGAPAIRADVGIKADRMVTFGD